jgi:hypothetical protein
MPSRAAFFPGAGATWTWELANDANPPKVSADARVQHRRADARGWVGHRTVQPVELSNFELDLKIGIGALAIACRHSSAAPPARSHALCPL